MGTSLGINDFVVTGVHRIGAEGRGVCVCVCVCGGGGGGGREEWG